MCGIIGVLGDHEAAPVLVEALKRLEYRGYDSAGIATVNHGVLDRRRAVGKLVNLSDKLVHEPLAGKAGIGHTRWATHGAPTEGNAHPHRGRTVAVVHNGIIENYRDLKDELKGQGVTFETETDTEIVALLTQRYMDEGLSPVDAAYRTIDRLSGAFALAFLFDGEEDLIVIARMGPPLAIGHGDGEMYVGSDAVALAPLTDRITYLEDGDRAVVTRTSVEIRDANGDLANREIRLVRAEATRVDKAGYRHFMAKEIDEQPTVISEVINAYVPAGADAIEMPGIDVDFAKVDRLVMSACGTAFNACLTAKYWFEKLARIPVEIDVASEFRYREPPVVDGTVALFVSQSGETADTLAALRYCEGKADRILGIVNVPESSIARESSAVLELHAGPEIGVASTKAFTAQLTVLLLLALKAAGDRGTLSADQIADRLAALRGLPAVMNTALDLGETVERIAMAVSEARDVLFLGRGTMYPLAMEGALKLKEISYIHAEGYASGELKHGPIALIDTNVPVVVLAPDDDLFDKTMSNLQEVIARGGKVILISDERGIGRAGDGLWHAIPMPKVHADLAPILYAVPAQQLAYHTAVAKGTDVDQPRNLAKSVTVE
ncbi:glutamine--fructose-6-phosphate transaminase (isomerizing) [Chachezhania antarctica]|uniref:glutamine--fructose-6-phosphate transaminase (isomerizing) n=1 Tax=Chachezhania antarctica TaxID=2340860 RepID=UPI000EB01D86|nr:glutamine--fructose-6-phosphate transaminase (isomerizing) [Chachezhania antarctica]|tara:strand:+ start:98 stop:1921 length:1824 start_codon:yes stop_codon:yes gene_type:complete